MLAKSFSSFDQPRVFNFAGTYTVPRLPGNKFVSWVLRDWEINAYLDYASGLPIPSPPLPPAWPTNSSSRRWRTGFPDVPLFTQDINCHCFDPVEDIYPEPGGLDESAARRVRNRGAVLQRLSLRSPSHREHGPGPRVRRLKERFSLEMRVDFANIFNRTYLNNPTATGFSNPQSTNTTGPLAGLNSGGFGYINLAASPTTPYAQPRNGTIVLRVRF